ncbi:MAG TPA: hypothetical protein VFS43_17410 [Polyangiaceae bacterium]|nr:hypothetical protein [Polyangiaceae bacterium]
MSSGPLYRPDPAALAAARGDLDEALARGGEGAADEALARGGEGASDEALARGGEGASDDDIFVAAGRLVALGARAIAAEALAGRAALRPAAERALARDDAEGELEDAAITLRSRLDALDEGAEAGGLAADVAAALARRDRAELRLLGAALALGVDPDRVEAGAAGRLEFEALVRPELFRLCAFNPARREALAALAPALRARFWWHYEGADLDPGAAAALPAVAALVASFPAAGERFASLVRARRAWASSPGRGEPGASSAPARPPAGPPYTLRDWVERRAWRGGPGAPASERLPLAAAPDDEVVLIDETDYQISWGPPAALIVDLVADRRPGARPTLRLGDGSIVQADEVEGAVERFAFSLPARALDETSAWLTLPLARGPLGLELPPGGREG